MAWTCPNPKCQAIHSCSCQARVRKDGTPGCTRCAGTVATFDNHVSFQTETLVDPDTPVITDITYTQSG